jgi:hypothetical protein
LSSTGETVTGGGTLELMVGPVNTTSISCYVIFCPCKIIIIILITLIPYILFEYYRHLLQGIPNYAQVQLVVVGFPGYQLTESINGLPGFIVG